MGKDKKRYLRNPPSTTFMASRALIARTLRRRKIQNHDAIVLLWCCTMFCTMFSMALSSKRYLSTIDFDPLTIIIQISNGRGSSHIYSYRQTLLGLPIYHPLSWPPHTVFQKGTQSETRAIHPSSFRSPPPGKQFTSF